MSRHFSRPNSFPNPNLTFISQVARWFALGLGIAYGFVHRRSLEKTEEMQKAQAAYNHKEELIQKAKAAYAAKQTSSSPLGGAYV